MARRARVATGAGCAMVAMSVAGAVACSCKTVGSPLVEDGACAEEPGIPVGEFHRAGQPCASCHEYVAAGTVFSDDSPRHGVDRVLQMQAPVGSAACTSCHAATSAAGPLVVSDPAGESKDCPVNPVPPAGACGP
jgi:hypothetical protein